MPQIGVPLLQAGGSLNPPGASVALTAELLEAGIAADRHRR